jgi:hypothetical protein
VSQQVLVLARDGRAGSKEDGGKVQRYRTISYWSARTLIQAQESSGVVGRKSSARPSLDPARLSSDMRDRPPAVLDYPLTLVKLGAAGLSSATYRPLAATQGLANHVSEPPGLQRSGGTPRSCPRSCSPAALG